MTDRAQFEAMLEALINEDQETAKEIFHNIVVGKSREIYEELLESDFNEGQDSGNPYSKDEEMEESEDDADDTESEDNPFGDEEGEDDTDGEEDGEEADDEEEPEFGDEEGDEGEGAIEDRVMDLEDALEDLKAEFEQLLQGEEHEEENEPGIHGGALDSLPGMDDEMGEPDMVMEYTKPVKSPTHGDNGANTRSAVAGANKMGGTAGNIAQSFSTTTGGTTGGLAAPTTKPQTGGNVNVPGASNATKLKPVPNGHGAEKKGAKPGQNVGAETGANSRDAEKNTQATLRPLKK